MVRQHAPQQRFGQPARCANEIHDAPIYGYHHRFRSVEGTRDVLFIHPDDLVACVEEVRSSRWRATQGTAGYAAAKA